MTDNHAYDLLFESRMRPAEARLLREAMTEIAAREKCAFHDLIAQIAQSRIPGQDIVSALRSYALNYFRQATPTALGGFSDHDSMVSATLSAALRALDTQPSDESS